MLSLLSPCLAAAQIQAIKDNGETDRQGTDTYHRLEEEVDTEAPARVGFSLLGSEIRLNGFAEFNAEYLDIADLEDPQREDSSDLFIGSLELAAQVLFNDWSKLKLVVAAEDFGRNGEEGRIIMSEVIVTLEAPWYPLYLVAGRTQMPFGIYENHLIEGTLTEEVYEIDDVGVIIGFAPDLFGLDLAVALYETPVIIDNLEEFDVFEKREERPEDDGFAAYAAQLSIEPLEDTVYLSVFYDNEPGDGRRNQSIGAAMGWSVWRVSLDTEWISALTREVGEDGMENKESAWLVGLAVEVTEAVELAGRYERFIDDVSGGQDEVLDYRWVAGGSYLFTPWASLALEYRYSKFEKEVDSPIEDQQHIVQLQLALEF
jgi:hypothetical protein